MDFESMFSNFGTLPVVNFAVSEDDVEDQLELDKPVRRTLFREFNRAAGPEMFDIQPRNSTFEKSTSSAVAFLKKPT